MIMRSSLNRKAERGAVLITALMILLLLTIFGISTMDTNILDERMAGNMRDRNTAFQAAETGLRAAENWLAAQPDLPKLRDNDKNKNSLIWDLGSPDAGNGNLNWWKDHITNQKWWTDNAEVVAADKNDPMWIPDVNTQPRYIIEKIPPILDSLEAAQALEGADVFLQVTSRGVGAQDSTVVVLQSVYKW